MAKLTTLFLQVKRKLDHVIKNCLILSGKIILSGIYSHLPPCHQVLLNLKHCPCEDRLECSKGPSLLLDAAHQTNRQH